MGISVGLLHKTAAFHVTRTASNATTCLEKTPGFVAMQTTENVPRCPYKNPQVRLGLRSAIWLPLSACDKATSFLSTSPANKNIRYDTFATDVRKCRNVNSQRYIPASGLPAD